MSLTKEIVDKKVNFEFNKEFINVFSNKIKDNDTLFLNNTLKEIHPSDSADLIENLEFVTKSIIHFLGLPWDNSLLNYYKAENKKELISTTSYNQVIKPIFFHARGRWKRYEKQFTNIYPTLEPWVRKFKYK